MAANDVADLLLRIDATTEGLRRELKKADRSVSGTQGKIDKRLKAIDRRFDSLGKSVARSLGRIGVSLAAAFSVREVYKATEAYTTINNRLKLVTGSSSDFALAQRNVFTVAQQTRQPLEATAELYQRIAMNQEQLGLSGQEVADITKTISQTMVISGTSAQSAQAAMVQLGQAFASGTLRGEELNSVLEQAPALAQSIAKGMGVTVGELRALGKEGSLTADAVIKSLQDQADAVEKQFGGMVPTIGQSVEQVQNSFIRLVGEVDGATGSSQGLSRAISEISAEIDKLTDRLTSGEFDEAISNFNKFVDQYKLVINEIIKTDEDAGFWEKAFARTPAGALYKYLGFGGKQEFDASVKAIKEGFIEIDNEAQMLENGRILAKRFGLEMDNASNAVDGASASVEKFTFTAKDLKDVIGDEVISDIERVVGNFRDFQEELYPTEFKTASLKAELKELNEVIEDGLLPPEARAKLIELRLKVDESTRAVQELTAEADPMETAYLRGIERMRDAFGDFMYDIIDQGKITFDRFLDLFKRMVAEIASTKIMLSLGLGGASMGAAASTGSGLSSLMSLGGLSSLLSSTPLAGIGDFLANTGMNMGSRTLHGIGTNLQGMSAMDIGLSALAGYAGSYLGSAAGKAIFGKEAESSWGSTLGGIGGAAIGGPIGAFIGAGIGSLADSLLGGDGYKRQAMGASVEPYWAGQDTTGYTRFGASGLRFHGTVAGKGDPALANQFVDMLAATDTALTTFFETLGNEIDLTGQTIKGSQSDNGKWGKFFFGSKDGSSFEDAMDGFVNAWLQKVEEVTGEVVNLDLIKDLGLEGEALGDTLNRISVEFVSVNAIFEAMGLTLYDTNVAGMAAADGLVQAMGGLDNLTASLSTYYDLFYTEQEKLDNITTQVQSVFDSLNLTMPDTRDGFRALVDSLDLTTSEGQNTFAALISVAGAFAEITPAVEDLGEEFVDTVDVMAKALDELDVAFADFERAVENQISVHQGNIAELEGQKQLIQDNLQGLRDNIDVVYSGMERWADQQIDSINAQADAQIDSLRKVTDASQTAYSSTVERLKDALDPIRDSISFLSDASGALRQTLYRLRPQSAEFDRKARANAQATLRGALGGNLPSMDVLNNALSVVSQDSTDQFGSKNAYLRDFFATQNTVSQLLRETEGQLTIEEQTLSGIEAHIDLAEKNHSENVDLINQQIQAINASREAQVKGVEDQLKLARDQINALDGIDTNVYTLSDVTRAIQTYEQAKAIADEQMLQIDQQIQNEFDSIALLEDQLEVETNSYQELKGISSGVSSVSAAIDRLHAAMAEVGTAAEIPAFAKGGFHKGGWGVFGENGPEIAYTPPTQVFTNADSQRMMQSLGGGEEQRAYNEAALRGIAKNTADIRKLRDIFDKWDADGMPAERTA